MSQSVPPTFSNGHAADDSDVLRHSRAHFPMDDVGLTRSRSTKIDDSRKFSSLGNSTPSRMQHSPLNPLASSTGGRRRRTRSVVDVTSVFSEPSPAPALKMPPVTERYTRRRTLTQPSSQPGPIGGSTSAPGRANGIVNDGFSDEYALAQEDPGILEDVERAVRLKARREARMKALQLNQKQHTVSGESQFISDFSPISTFSFSAQSSPAHMTFPSTSTPPLSHSVGPSDESAVDFSPTVGNAPPHPVPTSSNDGATLDWTRSASDEEKTEHKQWKRLSLKGKLKDRLALPSNKASIENQESIHRTKLARIKSAAQPNTRRKADITAEQLGRRYDAVYASLNSNAGPLNMSKVARWFDGQPPDIKTTLDQVEPLTWLKHLLDKRGEKASRRLPWHVTALIVEEFLKSQTQPVGSTSSVGSSPEKAYSPDQRYSPESVRSPRSSLAPSFSRKQSYDGNVSFEPIIEPERPHNRQSGDNYPRKWRHSMPSIVDSPRGSLSNSLGVSQNNSISTSPTSSRSHLRELAKRLRRRGHDSDDGWSSHHSYSDDPAARSDGGLVEAKNRLRRRQPPELRLQSPAESGTDGELIESREPSENGYGLYSTVGPLTARAPAGTASVKSGTSEGGASAARMGLGVPRQHDIDPLTTPRALRPMRRSRISLPSFDNLVREEEHQREEEEANEEQERMEYELKAQMLEDAMAQNQRIRQLLQRVATGVKDFECVRASLSKLLGMPQTSLPSDLLEAFSHDPAAVTGPTRRFRGWQAVEDIHDRLMRQNNTLRSFLLKATQEGGVLPSPTDIYDDPISSLLSSLERLDDQRRDIVSNARDVAELLSEVKAIHGEVKQKYNETLAHTSVVYPELSQIVALEESYKDNYQKLWEFGMNALTFLLDTVTPFWRNYGKVIGDDVQDFLIIPWYRNEFTGEPKKYPLKGLPKRSFRHWLGLGLFFDLSIALVVFQARIAAFSLSFLRFSALKNSGLWWIILPFCWIGLFIQSIAIVVECAIVGAQLAVIFWWIGWGLRILN